MIYFLGLEYKNGTMIYEQLDPQDFVDGILADEILQSALEDSDTVYVFPSYKSEYGSDEPYILDYIFKYKKP